jgi:hypothetical protein
MRGAILQFPFTTSSSCQAWSKFNFYQVPVLCVVGWHFMLVSLKCSKFEIMRSSFQKHFATPRPVLAVVGLGIWDRVSMYCHRDRPFWQAVTVTVMSD